MSRKKGQPKVSVFGSKWYPIWKALGLAPNTRNYLVRHVIYKQRDSRTAMQSVARNYKISLADISRMLRRQKNKCPICDVVLSKATHYEANGQRRTRVGYSVDHNHKTGKLRALLCHRCNAMLGYAKEKPGVLRAAAAWLEGGDANEPSG